MRALSRRALRSASTRVVSGYKGFGSFHSKDVEELVARACEPSWQTPPPPPLVQAAAAIAPRDDMRANFLLDDDWTFVNHGAFGAPCRAAFDVAAAWRCHAELQPLRFVDRELFPHLVASLRALGGVLNLSPRDLALMPNATAALNVAVPTAARARDLGPGAGLLVLDCGYGSVRTLAAKVCETPATLVDAWGTETLVDAASSAPSMALVRLPGPRHWCVLIWQEVLSWFLVPLFVVILIVAHRRGVRRTEAPVRGDGAGGRSADR